ncbi:SurA N-terminal domain-containing protein [Deltaproteobacteria bacterium OttesenSCG-928-M10]|nr:SurA N-terminal domain-containing protein [Deltaproteobacteria bacterium OttesenSCG-928-M10]
MIRRLHILFWLVLACGLAGCREKAWDPDVAALVNGRPIPKSAVIRVMELGFYPRPGETQERIKGSASVVQIVGNLIEEQLIIEEAEKIGLTVDEKELDESLSLLGSAWFGVEPPPAELLELKEAIYNQMLIRQMTEKIMLERRVLSADKWREFWEAWPKNKPPRYLVRALLLPPLNQAPHLPVRRRHTLENLAEYFERQDLEAVVSEPLWLGREFMAKDGVPEALKEAAAKKTVTVPLRLEESWVIYEILKVEPAPTPPQDFKAAMEAFESMAGEAAFNKWLTEVRAKSDIRINPVFLEMDS